MGAVYERPGIKFKGFCGIGMFVHDVLSSAIGSTPFKSIYGVDG
jgi:hypothetical protein